MKKCTINFFIFLLLHFSINSYSLAQTDARYAIIPYPQELNARSGKFLINEKTQLKADSNKLHNEILQLKELFPFISLQKTSASANSQIIELQLDNKIAQEEGYILDITSQKILLKGKSPAGIFRGIETLRQLAPVNIESQAKKIQSISIPAVFINDYPAYNYRGMHLDVARHFFSLEYVKKFIDRMALYKFNKLHFHLTDDQGWRIEIKKYPLLTQKGAFREFNTQDLDCIERAISQDNPDYLIDPKFIKMVKGKPIYGGFYTQEELRDLVAYALKKHIDIIPEIDMPGHMNIAVQNYPFLACGNTDWEPGKFSVPLCPCNEQTFEFAQNVYKEVFQIFPYEYVHLGADEVNKDSWKRSAACKVMMDKENIKDVNELQSYFVHRMEKFFNDNGKKLIGWDEILEGGISSTANVMYWRSWVPNAPVEAVNNGNSVIMTPGEPLYFDALPNKNSLYNVYHFNPVPKILNENQAKKILGAQANTWTEWIPSENRLEYLVYPRKLALSEVVWTNKQNWQGFLNRLSQHQKRLEIMGINYRLPDIEDLLDNYAFVNNTSFFVKSPSPELILRYTTDGSSPTKESKMLSTPLSITKPTTLKIAAFTKEGLRGDIYTAHFNKENYSTPQKKEGSELAVKLYNGTWKSTSDLDGKQISKQWKQNNIEVDKERVAGSDVFGLIYEGYINVPQTGIYTFYLTADDGAILEIGDKMVIDNDGLHSAKEISGQIALKTGAHKFVLKFIEGGGGYTLRLQMKAPGEKQRRNIPESWFK